jgi:hypothetical protein
MMNNKILSKKKVFIITFVFFAFALFSCGGNNKKGFMTINVAGDEVAVYETAFQNHFKLQAIDASQYGFNYVIPSSRYVLCVVSPDIDYSTLGVYEDGFFIVISDNGENISITFTYTVGAKESNPVIVNPNMLQGSMTVTRSLNLALPKEKEANERMAEIASAVYKMLVEIEGK